jgi:hypothetical protein
MQFAKQQFYIWPAIQLQLDAVCQTAILLWLAIQLQLLLRSYQLQLLFVQLQPKQTGTKRYGSF